MYINMKLFILTGLGTIQFAFEKYETANTVNIIDAISIFFHYIIQTTNKLTSMFQISVLGVAPHGQY